MGNSIIKEEVTGDEIGKKIDDKITKISKNLQQNNSERITNKHDKELRKKDIYISRRKTENYW